MGRRRVVTLIFAWVMSACAPADAIVAPDQPSKAAPSQGIVLTLGQPTRVDGTSLTITLHAVDDDSRCPEGVTCIWAGDVAARIRIDDGREPSREVALHLNTADREVAHGDYRVTLVAVTPYPKADEKIEPKSYRATVRVETR